jgi:SAM-dependent methyltransferase
MSLNTIKVPKASLNFTHFGHTLNLDDLRDEQSVSDEVFVSWQNSGVSNLTEFVAQQFRDGTPLSAKIDRVVSRLYSICEEVREVPTRVMLDSDRRQNRSLRSYFVQRFLRVFYGRIRVLDLGCGKCQLLKELMEKKEKFQTGFNFDYFGLDINFNSLDEVPEGYETSMRSYLRNKGFSFKGKLYRLDFSKKNSHKAILRMCKAFSITHVVGFNGLQYFKPSTLKDLVQGLKEMNIGVYSVMPDHDFISGSSLIPSVISEDKDRELKIKISVSGMVFDEYFLPSSFLESFGVVDTGSDFWLKTTNDPIESDVQLCSNRIFVSYPPMPVLDIVGDPIGKNSSDMVPNESCCKSINWVVLSTFVDSPPKRVRPKKNGIMVRLFKDMAVSRDRVVYRLRDRNSNPVVLDGFGEMIKKDGVWRLYPLDIRQLSNVKFLPNSYHFNDQFCLSGVSVRDLEDLSRYNGQLEGLVFDLGRMTRKRNTEVYMKPHLVLDLLIEGQDWRGLHVENFSKVGKFECVINLNTQILRCIREKSTVNSELTIERGVEFYTVHQNVIKSVYSDYATYPSFEEYCVILSSYVSYHTEFELSKLERIEIPLVY